MHSDDQKEGDSDRRHVAMRTVLIQSVRIDDCKGLWQSRLGDMMIDYHDLYSLIRRRA